eukprot:2664177-Pleurochrysis_carterae.AAC.1
MAGANSESALESAMDAWRTLLARVRGGPALWLGEPPVGRPAAVRRVVQVLRAAAASTATGAARQGEGTSGQRNNDRTRDKQGRRGGSGSGSHGEAHEFALQLGRGGQACVSVRVPRRCWCLPRRRMWWEAREAAFLPQPDGVRAEARCHPGVSRSGVGAAGGGVAGAGEGRGRGDRVVEARDEIHALVDAVLAGDLDLAAVVKLLGGRRQARVDSRAGSFDGQVPLGRWGVVEGDLAPADIAAAMAVLADLMHDARCAVGGGLA